MSIEMNEKIKWKGKIIIKKIRNGKIISHRVEYNLITNLGLDELLKSFYTVDDMHYRYLAIGTGNTAAAANDTTLETEIYRTPIITQTKTGTGELTSRAILLETEPWDEVPPPAGYQCTIKEIGYFGGWQATITPDSGILIARLVLTTPEDKYDNEQVVFTRVDSIERG